MIDKHVCTYRCVNVCMCVCVHVCVNLVILVSKLFLLKVAVIDKKSGVLNCFYMLPLSFEH